MLLNFRLFFLDDGLLLGLLRLFWFLSFDLASHELAAEPVKEVVEEVELGLTLACVNL